MEHPTIRLADWRKVLLVWLLTFLIVGTVYMLGEALRIWAVIFPASVFWQVLFGLAASWILGRILLGVYSSLVARALIKDYFEGFKHLQAGQFDEALAAFERQYAFFDQRPHLEKWYSLITLDASKYGHRELALINQAYVYIQMGKGDQVIRCYEQCAALNPGNGLAISNLNTANAVLGGEIRPMPEHIPFRGYIDLRLQRRLRWLSLAAFVVFYIPCSVFSTTLIFLSRDAFADVPVAFIGSAILCVMSVWLYRLVSMQMALFDFYRGERLLKARRYREAIHAYLMQTAFFNDHPWVDEWRWIILLSPSAYSYREWVLLRMAYAYKQLGEGSEAIKLYEECLNLNPVNGLAASNLNFIHAVLSSGSSDQPEVERSTT